MTVGVDWVLLLVLLELTHGAAAMSWMFWDGLTQMPGALVEMLQLLEWLPPTPSPSTWLCHPWIPQKGWSQDPECESGSFKATRGLGWKVHNVCFYWSNANHGGTNRLYLLKKELWESEAIFNPLLEIKNLSPHAQPTPIQASTKIDRGPRVSITFQDSNMSTSKWDFLEYTLNVKRKEKTQYSVMQCYTPQW